MLVVYSLLLSGGAAISELVWNTRLEKQITMPFRKFAPVFNRQIISSHLYYFCIRGLAVRNCRAQIVCVRTAGADLV